MSPRSTTEASEVDQRRRQIIEEIDALGPVLPGSLVQRTSRCGNSGCRCHADPPRLHGPYWTWTRSVEGKTVTRSLTDEQAERYQPWFDNARRLRQLIDDLKQLGIQRAREEEPRLPN
jgi:hypothetical protein